MGNVWGLHSTSTAVTNARVRNVPNSDFAQDSVGHPFTQNETDHKVDVELVMYLAARWRSVKADSHYASRFRCVRMVRVPTVRRV